MLLGKLMFQFTRFAIQALHLVFVSWLTIVFVGGSLFLSKFVTTSTIFSWSLGNLNISCCNNSQCTELLSAHCLHIQVHSFAHILSNKSHSRHLQTQVHSSTNTLCNKYYSQKSQNAVKPIAYKKKATVNAHLTNPLTSPKIPMSLSADLAPPPPDLAHNLFACLKTYYLIYIHGMFNSINNSTMYIRGLSNISVLWKKTLSDKPCIHGCYWVKLYQTFDA